MVPIESCPECGSSLQVPEEQVGGRIECPDCGKRFLAREVAPREGAPRAHRAYDDGPRGGDRNLKEASSKKLAAGLCGILVGALGIHKFVLGFTTAGVIMLLVSLLGCGVGPLVMWVIGLVEGILYLTKSDEDFHRIYMVEKKEWF